MRQSSLYRPKGTCSKYVRRVWERWKIIVHFWNKANTCVYRHLIQRIFKCKHPETQIRSLSEWICYSLGTLASSPPPCFLSLPSLLDEMYQTIIQHRITKGNQDCFVHLCGCLFPLWSLPLFFSHPQPPNAPTHKHIRYIITPRLSHTQRMHMRNTCGSHLHNGTMLSRRSDRVSSV